SVSHELRDQYSIRLVIAEVIVVRRTRLVVHCNEVALSIKSSAHFHRKCGALRIPRRFLLPHPLHPNGPANFFSEERSFEPRIISCSTAVGLRSFHPNHSYPISRHLQKLRDTGPQAIRLHVV